MKPDFALDFRDSQIALLHRQEGGWATIGRVEMDDPDLDAAMGYLRATALGLSPRGIATKLILPNEAILYTNLPDLPHDPSKRGAQIAVDLTGRTPYAVDELVWDWTDSGASADVAVIARETLAEAEGFATQHRFNPISFAAIPNSGNFDGEVWFGATDLSQTLLAKGEVVERDDAFVAAPEAPPAAELAATDFEMGAAAADFSAEDSSDANTSSDTAPEETPVESIAPQSDLPEPDLPEGAQPSDDAPDQPDPIAADAPAETEMAAQLPLDLGQSADVAEPAEDHSAAVHGAPKDPTEYPREVWQDFVAGSVDALPDNANAAQIAADLPPQDAPPASFDDAMQEATGQNGEPALDGAQEVAADDLSDDDDPVVAQGETSDEAPMAVDVPLMDETDVPEVSLGIAEDGTDVATGPSETPMSKSEQLVAAFAARRAAALAQAEADTNAAPTAAALAASDEGAPEQLTAAAEGGTQVSADVTPDLSDAAAQPSPLPKLGSAAAGLGNAPQIAAMTGLKPVQIKPIPAKDLPKKPQNLKAMPQTNKGRGRGIMLWVLLAALLIALVTAGAISSYVLESFNKLFISNTAIVTATPADQPSALADAAQKTETLRQNDAAPQIAQPASLPAAIKAPSSALSLPSPAQQQAAVQPAAAPPLPILPDPIFTALAEPNAGNAAIPVTTGKPALIPSPRPDIVLAAARTISTAANPSLSGARPLPRPGGVIVAAPVTADPALAGARPLPRPAEVLAAGNAARIRSASLLASAEQPAAARPAEAQPAANLSALALTISLVPPSRPKGLKAAYDAAQAASREVASAAVVPETAPKPSAEPQPDLAEETEEVSFSGGAGSRSVVAKKATVKNAMNLGQVNLVGVFGSKSNRYALIRQPSGTFKKLKVGDRFDGGKVAAITESELRYAKGGQMLALHLPKT